MSEVFSRGFVHVAAQKYPVQIVIVEDKKEIQKIHNAWFTSIGYIYTTGDWIILEEAILEAEKIADRDAVKSDDEHEDVEDEQKPD